MNHTIFNSYQEICGFQQELKIQDRIRNLQDVIQNRMLVVYYNIKKETIRHYQLKKVWNNEIDILIIDPVYGLFITEVKSKCYANLKASTSKKYSLATEIEKQTKRYNLLDSIRSYSTKLADVPIHTVLICNAMKSDTTQITEVYKCTVCVFPDIILYILA